MVSEEYRPDTLGRGWSLQYTFRDVVTPDKVDVYATTGPGGGGGAPAGFTGNGAGTLGGHVNGGQHPRQHSQHPHSPPGMGAGAVVLVRDALRSVSASMAVYLRLTAQSRVEVRVPAQATMTVVPWMAEAAAAAETTQTQTQTQTRGARGTHWSGARGGSDGGAETDASDTAAHVRRTAGTGREQSARALQPPPRMVLPIEEPRRVTLSELTR